MKKLAILKELLGFLWQRKKWWLVPMILVLVLLGFLMLFVQSTSVAPFIYVLF
jgi:hypothetical protein